MTSTDNFEITISVRRPIKNTRERHAASSCYSDEDDEGDDGYRYNHASAKAATVSLWQYGESLEVEVRYALNTMGHVLGFLRLNTVDGRNLQRLSTHKSCFNRSKSWNWDPYKS